MESARLFGVGADTPAVPGKPRARCLPKWSLSLRHRVKPWAKADRSRTPKFTSVAFHGSDGLILLRAFTNLRRQRRVVQVLATVRRREFPHREINHACPFRIL